MSRFAKSALVVLSGIFLILEFGHALFVYLGRDSRYWDVEESVLLVGGAVASLVLLAFAIGAILKQWAINRVVKMLIMEANRSNQQSRKEECDAHLRAIVQIALQTGFSPDLVEFAAPSVVVLLREVLYSRAGRFEVEWLKKALAQEVAKNEVKGLTVAD
jgi:hypothetical protein